VAATSPRAPELPPRPAPLTDKLELDHNERLELVALRELDLSDQRVGAVAIAAAVLDTVDLSGSALEQLSLTDVEFVGCNLSNVNATNARLSRVRIRNSRMTGFRVSGAVLRDVTFTDCRIDLASFGASRLERVTFEGCRLAQTDFIDSQLQDVRFDRCDLTEEDFRGVILRRCEARSCELSAIRGAERLRGLSMPWPEIVANAGVWASALGIAELED
jgi:uncharacterized protein YjbI with pentapeptide repeats